MKLIIGILVFVVGTIILFHFLPVPMTILYLLIISGVILSFFGVDLAN
jgi:hypothetical protein